MGRGGDRGGVGRGGKQMGNDTGQGTFRRKQLDQEWRGWVDVIARLLQFLIASSRRKDYGLESCTELRSETTPPTSVDLTMLLHCFKAWLYVKNGRNSHERHTDIGQ